MPTNCTAAHDPDRESRIEVATQSSTMGITSNITDPLQIRLTSAVETILASLAPYAEWIEQVLDAPLSDTLTIEVDCNPGDVVAEELLQGLSIASATRARNSFGGNA
jgi:hypothetical protein